MLVSRFRGPFVPHKPAERTIAEPSWVFTFSPGPFAAADFAGARWRQQSPVRDKQRDKPVKFIPYFLSLLIGFTGRFGVRVSAIRVSPSGFRKRLAGHTPQEEHIPPLSLHAEPFWFRTTFARPLAIGFHRSFRWEAYRWHRHARLLRSSDLRGAPLFAPGMAG
jgi:hypothetical protein